MRPGLPGMAAPTLPPARSKSICAQKNRFDPKRWLIENKEITDAMKADYASWMAGERKKMGNYWKNHYGKKNVDIAQPERANELGFGLASKDAKEEIRHRVAGFWDTLGDLSGGEVGRGHPIDYYKKNPHKEAFANVFRAIVKGWKEYDEAFPLTSKVIRSKVVK